MVTKAGGDCCRLPLKKTTEKDKEEVTPSLAAATEISLDAAEAVVLSQLRTAPKAFLGDKVNVSLPGWLWQESS